MCNRRSISKDKTNHFFPLVFLTVTLSPLGQRHQSSWAREERSQLFTEGKSITLSIRHWKQGFVWQASLVLGGFTGSFSLSAYREPS